MKTLPKNQQLAIKLLPIAILLGNQVVAMDEIPVRRSFMSYVCGSWKKNNKVVPSQIDEVIEDRKAIQLEQQLRMNHIASNFVQITSSLDKLFDDILIALSALDAITRLEDGEPTTAIHRLYSILLRHMVSDMQRQAEGIIGDIQLRRELEEMKE